MLIEIKVPSPGESITEVELSKWLVEDGAAVEKGEDIAEIESDKATLTLTAEEAGKVKFSIEEGATIEVGAVACTIDTEQAAASADKTDSPAAEPTTPENTDGAVSEIKIPSPGESITEVEIGKWMVEDGAMVEKDQDIAEIESDKATLTLTADQDGKIAIIAQEGDTVEVGSVACTITATAGSSTAPTPEPKQEATNTAATPKESAGGAVSEVKIPSPGESITEVEIGKWMVEDGAMVEKDQDIAEIESDKATLTLTADQDGKIAIKALEGDTVQVGSVACTITAAAGNSGAPTPEPKQDSTKITAPAESASGAVSEIKIPSPGESITEVEIGKWMVEDGAIVEKDQDIAEIESDKATLTLTADQDGKIAIKAQEGDTVEVGSVACTITATTEDKAQTTHAAAPQNKSTSPNQELTANSKEGLLVKITPVAQEMMRDNNLSVDDIIGEMQQSNGMHRITKKEVQAILSGSASKGTPSSTSNAREENRTPMSALRKKLSQRLVNVKNETAMLTTFNEVDMKPIMDLRKENQERFIAKHGTKLGFMSFFTKAVAIAMQYHPMVNAMIDGEEIIQANYVDVGIAVQTPKGLMVPIVRNAEQKSISAIEIEIKELAEKARNKKISIDEITGGTFTITNGGTFGSLMSTPIINPPQSAILGMHNIQERPIAVNGEVVIRPMMYIALSYDHRVIDGKDSVGFLVKVKNLLENPETIISEGKNINDFLLDL